MPADETIQQQNTLYIYIYIRYVVWHRQRKHMRNADQGCQHNTQNDIQFSINYAESEIK